MKNPARHMLRRSIEKSIERLPQGLSYVKDEAEHTSAFKNIGRTAVERNELTHLGQCVTDIEVKHEGDVDVVQYVHVIGSMEAHSFRGRMDELSLMQLGRVARNLYELSNKLEDHSVNMARPSTLDS